MTDPFRGEIPLAAVPIPVILLTGFLGSGKTTLLNRLLRAGGGTRIGAVVNDFGSIEIDAMAVAGQVDAMVSLGNGCLCCAVDASELEACLDRLAATGRIDVIVVEASGLAEPVELVRMVLAGENPRLVYGGLVEVVDAAEFDATRERHPEIDRHLGVADLVVLNKADRVGRTALDRLRETVAALSPGTAVVETAYGRVDPALLFDPRPRRDTATRQLSFADILREEEDDHADHAHARYDSVAFTSHEPLDPRRLMAFLDRRPEGLYRVKGHVHFAAPGDERKFGLHTVGSFLRFTPAPWAADERPQTRLVLIGTGIDADRVHKELDACRADADLDRETAERGMWGVLRFVQPAQDQAAAPPAP
ncbi:GTP-binding protein [Streptomyces sp. NPDC051940]|uniref:CobW family GTP-binding protein n=1 Tax=Streptomyces sp. NPDC051940 TaxID=3155675 RepID=UPI00342AD5BC